jgi:hypothetical protein
MEKSHIGSAERLWIAGEINRLIEIASAPGRTESRWADNLVRNVYLWYWTADGLNAKDEVQRDLIKTDPSFLRHTPEALRAIGKKGDVIHEHAVPRRVILRHLKARRWGSPIEIKEFLDRFCFGVIISKEQDGMLKAWKHEMPGAFSESSDPLERYRLAELIVLDPKYPRLP